MTKVVITDYVNGQTSLSFILRLKDGDLGVCLRGLFSLIKGPTSNLERRHECNCRGRKGPLGKETEV